MRDGNAACRTSPAFTATSSPTSSRSASGPTGIPKSVITRSTSSIAHPSRTRRTPSERYGARIRLTRKPGESRTTTGVFPSARAKAKTVATHSSEVRGPRMTSTSGMRWTGLKKCIPATRPAWIAPAEISAMGSVEVFEAKIASSGTAASQSFRTARLTPSFSTTASMVTSQRAKPV